MGGNPEIMIRRVKTNDGNIALEIITDGQICAFGSSMNTFYITTNQNYLAKAHGQSFAPHADKLDTEA
jgi:hypothetical protein